MQFNTGWFNYIAVMSHFITTSRILSNKLFNCYVQCSELNRNKIKNVDGLTFQGLGALKSLKMQRNGVTKLMDGAFWGLSNMEIL